MNTTGSTALAHTSSPGRLFVYSTLFIQAILLFGLAIASGAAQIEEPEDQYLRIYGVIQQADSLNTKGESAKALSKYRDAHKSLEEFHRNHPEWNAKTVSF